MNYLAHAYLSFGDSDILAGNIFSDFIKGKKKFDFPQKIQNGISLHRSIDQFTDSHRSTATAKKYFKPIYGLYASPFVDIAFDHFLATDEKIFNPAELEAFSKATYSQLEEFESLFPDRFKTVFHYMRLHNWLFNYQFQEGIFRSFGGLVHRASFMDDPRPACEIFVKYYNELKESYEEFFPELRAFALGEYNILTNPAT